MKTLLTGLIRISAIFAASVICFVLGKVLFICMNHDLFSGIGFSDLISIIYHGLPMDFSLAGYVTVIPALIQTASVFTGTNHKIFIFQRWYLIFISIAVSLAMVLDASLYSYWQFKLDSTPLFYFFSSPGAAFASAMWWQLVLFPVIWWILAYVFHVIYRLAVRISPNLPPRHGRKAVLECFGMFFITALLIIPIRGGVTVSTMNLSRSYFSTDIRLNHAAVNPVFSLMYSLSHQADFSSQFQYFPPVEAELIFNEHLKEITVNPTDSTSTPLTVNNRPDIIIIILESFSSHLFPSLGGEPIAVKLDSVAASGLSFTNFYSNSFRTDRGIPCILSGFPGQPTTSVMKFTDKIENLPSIAKTLRDSANYATHYFYGGDINFTNMKAYLMSGGFEKITSDVDFPISQRLSKWGAHDEVVFNRAYSDISSQENKRPNFTVIQTSSSHEPFEVPFSKLKDKRANSFAYADSCAADFIAKLKKTENWDNTLVIAVPDHYGSYPQNLESPIARHAIPMIMTGGALRKKGLVNTTGSQADIAATLISSLGIGSSEFKFSHNLLNPDSPHYAFFADRDIVGFVKNGDAAIVDLATDKVVSGQDSLANLGRTYLQILYKNLSEL